VHVRIGGETTPSSLDSSAVPLPEHVLRFWCSLDDLLGDVRPTWWGAVVTDVRFPAIWDINYARIDEPAVDLSATEVEAELVPSLRAVGTNVLHVVTFHHEATTRLLSELSSRGHRVGWDLVMEVAPAPVRVDADVEELEPGPELWGRVADTLTLFGAEAGEPVDQLRRMEEEVLAPGGKRWFGIRNRRGTIVSLAALVRLGDVGYIDNVATFPRYRGRGFATAVTSQAIDVAYESGAAHVCLFADPDDRPVVQMYERLGFRAVGKLASTRGPVPEA
jgi:ribosomal protein S18 acetylase RimI-like enzyme